MYSEALERSESVRKTFTRPFGVSTVAVPEGVKVVPTIGGNAVSGNTIAFVPKEFAKPITVSETGNLSWKRNVPPVVNPSFCSVVTRAIVTDCSKALVALFCCMDAKSALA